MSNKQIMRQQLKLIRSNIADKQSKDKIITDKLRNTLFDFDNIFCYVSMDSEVNTHNIIRELFNLGRKIFVPYTVNKQMKVARLNNVDDLTTDKWGNVNTEYLKFDSETIQVAVVPMLGFNESLYRIGYGGGYYDKYLAQFHGLKVGVAYDEQLTQFAPQEFDISLDLIITPDKN